jgi:hypothetical protein
LATSQPVQAELALMVLRALSEDVFGERGAIEETRQGDLVAAMVRARAGAPAATARPDHLTHMHLYLHLHTQTATAPAVVAMMVRALNATVAQYQVQLPQVRLIHGSPHDAHPPAVFTCIYMCVCACMYSL